MFVEWMNPTSASHSTVNTLPVLTRDGDLLIATAVIHNRQTRVTALVHNHETLACPERALPAFPLGWMSLDLSLASRPML